MNFYGNCGDFRLSINVLYTSVKDVVSWTVLASAYMEKGIFDVAMEAFHSMRSSGLRPDLISWNALISGFAPYREIDAALQYLYHTRKGLSPRVNSLNGVISGCVHNGHFTNALDVFVNMLLFPRVQIRWFYFSKFSMKIRKNQNPNSSPRKGKEKRDLLQIKSLSQIKYLVVFMGSVCLSLSFFSIHAILCLKFLQC